MPSKNTVRNFIPYSSYHVFNRGVEKREIFLDHQDRNIFLSLFDRHLNSLTVQRDPEGGLYEDFSDQVDLRCYCLMGNHYHFLLGTMTKPEVLSQFMRVFSGSYTRYFNKKYNRVGPLFQSRFKSVIVENDNELLNLSRYIHLNPSEPFTYDYSSLKYYISHERPPRWINTTYIQALLDQRGYFNYMKSGINGAA